MPKHNMSHNKIIFAVLSQMKYINFPKIDFVLSNEWHGENNFQIVMQKEVDYGLCRCR